MGALGDLLELMHTAARRRTSVAGTYRAWWDERLLRMLEDATDVWLGEEFENRRTGRREVEVSTRFWFEPPQRLRLERRDAEGALALLVVVNDDRRGVFTAGWGGEVEDHSSDETDWVAGPLARLLDPGPLVGSLEIEAVVDRASVAGRTAVVAEARERSPLAWPFGPADRHELFVDEENGTLLKLVGYAREREALVHELTEVAFGLAHDAEAFTFAPPRAHVVSGLGLRDAARLASLTVWALPIPVLDVTYRGTGASAGTPESVALSYTEVTLFEAAAGEPHGFTAYEEPTRIDRRGQTYWASARTLTFQRDGTFVAMTALSDASADQLVEWAETLAPVD